jgi:hypothetical protein
MANCERKKLIQNRRLDRLISVKVGRVSMTDFLNLIAIAH